MSTLTVTIKEALTLNGREQGSTNTKTISNITQVLKTIVECPTSEINLLTFASAATGVTTLDQDDVEYIRMTNLDTTNYITIGIEKESSTASIAAFRLDAGRSFIVATSNASAEHPQFFASAAAHDSSATQIDIETITALANTAACKLELFVALNTTT
tara:strand:+ start:3504 stop:3977 length:474 start_codon:yes stop_codon:yes gene_type:complete